MYNTLGKQLTYNESLYLIIDLYWKCDVKMERLTLKIMRYNKYTIIRREA